MLHVKFTSRPFDKLKSQCAIVTAFTDLRPLHGNSAVLDWRLNGRLSKLMQIHKFNGQFKETLLMPAEGRVYANDIIVVGLGEKNKFDESQISDFIQYLLNVLDQRRIKDFMISLSDMIEDRFEWRNAVRLLVSKLHSFPNVESARLCESEECVKDAKRRHMDFGLNVEVSFETLN